MRRTLLVDFDLRRPVLDGVFGLPLEPGVCDALRGKGDAAALIRPTSTDHLSVLTAGRWDRMALASLANGAGGGLFQQLRRQFDFVIVDSSPILPVADTRFVSQHADAVLLSVFRDISEFPKIQAACEILDAFGVHDIEAVVTGGPSFAYGRESSEESR
jgi:Mrp family chromosome partitioning ATPase